jgi:hypothetical protein
MTPAATTPAGRGAKPRTAGAAKPRTAGAAKPRTAGAPRQSGQTAAGHRRTVRRPASPQAPRRVSGPAGGRAATAQPAAPRFTGARRPAKPRRGTARPRIHGATLGARLLAYVRALPDHPLLDKAIRGRAWIPLLGVMLVGIVAMQVEVLKLGASMGRAIERGTALQSTNELLRENVASLADDQRIERLAAARGMVMPAPAGVGFLSARSGRNVQRALANIHTPSSASFLALTTGNGAVAAALTASTAITLTASAPSAYGASSASTSPSSSTSAATTAGMASTDPSSTISAGAASASPSVPSSTTNIASATGAAVSHLPGSATSSGSTIPASPATGTSTSSGQ